MAFHQKNTYSVDNNNKKRKKKAVENNCADGIDTYRERERTKLPQRQVIHGQSTWRGLYRIMIYSTAEAEAQTTGI